MRFKPKILLVLLLLSTLSLGACQKAESTVKTLTPRSVLIDL